MNLARIAENGRIVSATELQHGAISRLIRLTCTTCPAELVFVGSSGFITPHFRTRTNELHVETCKNFSDLTFDLERIEARTGVSDELAAFCHVSGAVTVKLVYDLLGDPNKLKIIDQRVFEELIAELFDGFGYNVELTKMTRDGGKDIIAVSHNSIIHQKYLIECKRPEPGNPVRIGVVKSLHATKIDEGANKAILVTTTRYTRDAKVYGERHPIELQLNDFHDLMEWLRRYVAIKRAR
ncbi:hypothetical protein BCO18430_06423 [Burkholderia contaminans]|nr:hypothetical protein BCO18430_06423 [Burkholderia contaminans]